MKQLVMAIDQGTTSSRAIVFDLTQPDQVQIVAEAQQEFEQHYPREGWVEHQPDDIWQTVLSTAQKAMAQAEAQGDLVSAIAITNQRETTLVWEKSNGQTLYPAIVWQDRRTGGQCKQLKRSGHEPSVQQKTGLLLDPYFSASKVHWILEHIDGARAKAEQGKLAFGTVDSYLIYRLTQGREHVTDATNASRTSLFNIHQQQWDPELLQLFDVPAAMMPRVLNCADQFGTVDKQWFGREIPIVAVAGDQQAATVGQGCFQPGEVKSTYGTGCFVLMNTGNKAPVSRNRLLTTVAYRLNGQVTYGLEGSIFIAGAAIQWLRDGLGVIENASASESLAEQADLTQQVYMVPAFTGLGAPHWDADARGAIFGLTRNTGPAELCRAALHSVCYQTQDLLSAMAADGQVTACLKVDGGMVANHNLMQALADLTHCTVARPTITETTALGVAYLAALQLGWFKDVSSIAATWQLDQQFNPTMASSQRDSMLAGWQHAVQRTLTQPQ